jgi:hypothetical protein
MVSSFGDWIRRIGFKTTWLVGRLTRLSCCCADHTQLIFKLRDLIAVILYGMRLYFCHFMYFVLPKVCLCVLLEVNLCGFYAF